MARPVFIDTSGLMAVSNRTDQWHTQAVNLSRKFRADKRIKVTTEWVLGELLASLARPPWRRVAVGIVEQFLANKLVRIITATSDDWQAGFDLYRSRLDKSWSLVDCVSILVCQRLAIREVFTGDQHFKQAGFKVLLTSTA